MSSVAIAWGRPVSLLAPHHGEWRKLVLRDPRLSMGARVVACLVLENIHMGRGKKATPHLVGFAYKAEATYGAEIGVSERQIRRCIEELERLGYVEVTARKVRLANGLRLLWPPLPFDRTTMSGKRKARTTPPKSPATGQFCPDRPDNFGTVDRSGLSRDYPEDLHEDLLERAGVSRKTIAAYLAACSGGTPEERKAAFLQVAAERGLN